MERDCKIYISRLAWWEFIIIYSTIWPTLLASYLCNSEYLIQKLHSYRSNCPLKWLLNCTCCPLKECLFVLSGAKLNSSIEIYSNFNLQRKERRLSKLKFNNNITLKMIKGAVKIFKNYYKVKSVRMKILKSLIVQNWMRCKATST